MKIKFFGMYRSETQSQAEIFVTRKNASPLKRGAFCFGTLFVAFSLTEILTIVLIIHFINKLKGVRYYGTKNKHTESICEDVTSS